MLTAPLLVKVPEKVGFARGAAPRALRAAIAVVWPVPPFAIATVPVTFVALPVRAPEKVGAVTVPVKVGLARGALRASLP